MKKLQFIFLFFICSCGSFSFRSKEEGPGSMQGYRQYQTQDYIAHLKSLEKSYLVSLEQKPVTLKKDSLQYLESLVSKIVKNNELFFTNKDRPSFQIIYSENPFHFSLPGRKFFFSTSLLRKYISSETMLLCLLTYELIRSEKNLYPKAIIVPRGFIETERILSLLRLETEDKSEVHKWAFYSLKRIGVDPDSYLSWLQVKNRNSLDFALQIGDVQSISKEEALFKAFLIQEVNRGEDVNNFKGSSREFYRFIGQI
jgi:hypothetical protein